MATRMQQRRGTSDQWIAANPVLATGEIGFESDTNKFKIGDGLNNWLNLSYFLDEDSLGGSLDGYVASSLLGQANGVATLDMSGKVPSSQLPDLGELSQDAINDALTPGEGITKNYDDTSNLLTIGVDTTVIANKNYVNDTIDSEIQSALGGASSQEVSYLTGVTSSIQVQLDSKLEQSDLNDYVTDTDLTNAISAIPSPDLSAYATRIYVDDAINDLIDGAPAALDTLNELAAAIGDDANYAGAVTSALMNKQNTVAGVSDLEIGYLSNVTSDIQEQLDDKASASHTHAIADVTNLVEALADKADLVNGFVNPVQLSKIQSETIAPKLVVVGNQSSTGVSAAFSTDGGTTWTSSSLTGADLAGVTYANGRFVATGFNDTAYYSDDGQSWTSVPLPNSNAFPWNNVVYGEGKFVTVAGTKAAYSTDGTSWTEAIIDTDNRYSGVTYGGGKFYASAVYDNSFGTTNKLAQSEDGITWTTITLPESSNWTRVVYANGNLFVLVESGQSSMLVSSDGGSSWTSRTLSSSGGIRDIAFGNGIYVAAGKEFLYTSTDAATWNTSFYNPLLFYTNVEYLDGTFYATGRRNTGNGARAVVTTADNGENWTTGSFLSLSTVPFFDGFVAVNAATIAEVDIASTSYVDSAIAAIPAPDFTGYATETYVNAAVSNLVDSAPSALDTLNELAAALGDDANFATTVTNAIADKAALTHTHNASAITYTIEDKSANYTIVASDEGKVIRSTGSAITVTVADVFSIGEVVTFTQYGAGQITFTPAGGVTLHSVDSKRKTNKQYSTVQIMKTAASTYLLFGDISA